MVKRNYARIVKRIREARKITQKELADFMGVSENIVSYWERGTRYPSLKNQRAIDKLFDETKTK